MIPYYPSTVQAVAAYTLHWLPKTAAIRVPLYFPTACNCFVISLVLSVERIAVAMTSNIFIPSAHTMKSQNTSSNQTSLFHHPSPNHCHMSGLSVSHSCSMSELSIFPSAAWRRQEDTAGWMWSSEEDSNYTHWAEDWPDKIQIRRGASNGNCCIEWDLQFLFSKGKRFPFKCPTFPLIWKINAGHKPQLNFI